ncbi:MAG: YggT family protein [Anaerolineales bacterium]|jgi:YggT family protein|nr:YggT family protein [Anaerolineales bacterium]
MVLETIITVIEQTLLLLILLNVVLSYFMDPYHPFRQSVDKLIEPMLRPIRQVVPSFGRFDFSPIILMILVEILAAILRNII